MLRFSSGTWMLLPLVGQTINEEKWMTSCISQDVPATKPNRRIPKMTLRKRVIPVIPTSFDQADTCIYDYIWVYIITYSNDNHTSAHIYG